MLQGNQHAAFRHIRKGMQWVCVGLLLLLAGSLAAAQAPQVYGESPRVQALLEQAWAAESGRGIQRSPALAAMLYQEAGQLGCSEGYYRAALVYWHHAAQPMPVAAFCRLAVASQLGHLQARALLENERQRLTEHPLDCASMLDAPLPGYYFDLDGYLTGLAQSKQRVAGLIRRLAPRYRVDAQLALAVAAVESDFNNLALSPKNAMGIMQLIPATAERFAVQNPYDPEQNIRGGLAYLRWLHDYYRGDVVLVLAAYNAGEKAVDRHGGIPPYAETLAYVRRVLAYSGKRLATRTSPTRRPNDLY